jgi:Flp pilus assembly protein TadD
MVREAVAIYPEGINVQYALGNVAARLGHKDEARKAWQAALALAGQLEPDVRAGYVSGLEDRLKKL